MLLSKNTFNYGMSILRLYNFISGMFSIIMLDNVLFAKTGLAIYISCPIGNVSSSVVCLYIYYVLHSN